MISNKNKVIVLLVSLFLIVGSIILILNKDEEIKKVESDSKKYSKVNVSDGYSNPSKSCDLWFDNIENQFVSYKDVDSNDRNLFIVDHCAWDPYDIIENKNNKFSETQIKEVCNKQKEMIQNIYISSNTYVNKYNEKCKEYTEKLEVSYDGDTCSFWKDKIQNDYVSYYTFYNDTYLKEMYCSEIDIPTKPYKTGDSCETLKLVDANGNLYKGVLKIGDTYNEAKNECAYPLYYIDGYATTIDDYLKKIDNEKKQDACNVKKDYAIVVNTQKEIDEYNKYCVDGGVSGHPEKITKKEEYTVTFDENRGNGLECEGYAISNGVCQYKFSDDTSDLAQSLDTSKLKYYNSSFKGWSLSSDCSTIDYSGNFQLDKSMNGKTFYACYEDVIFNNKIYTTCDDAGDSESTLTSKIETTFEYSKKRSNKLSDNVTSKTVEGILINKDIDPNITTDKTYYINPYVKIVCTENFQYTYPSIFETVKSGTYFELIYNPQIHSTYTCTQTFINDDWETDYRKAIKEELLVKLDEINSKIIENPDNINEIEGSPCGDDGITSEIIYEIPYYGGFEFAEDDENKTITLNPIKDLFITRYCPAKEDPPDLKKEYLNYVKSFVDKSYKLWDIFKTSTIDDYVKKHVGNRYLLEDINQSYKSILSSISTKQYYQLSPKLQFNYDNNKNISLVYGNNSKYTKYTGDNIKYNNDVYSIDDYNGGTKVSFGNNIVYSWSISNGYYSGYSGYDSISTNFSLHKYSPITRTKEIRLTYEQEKNKYNHFFADYQTGKITSEADTVKTDNRIDLGYVYPVDLNSSGERKISFKLDTSSDLSKPVKEILKQDGNNEYKCSFQITNDAVIKNTNKDTSSKSDEEKYKVKFYVRPIATNDIDPNNRLDSGLLGANWASRKGQLLMQIIQDKSKGNNTYNRDNLEYSFTLSAQNIDKIRKYNKTNEYDDFKLSCNKMGGECKSIFLDGFANGDYGSVVNTVNTNGRNRRKYYIGGKWYWTDSLILKPSNKYLKEVSSDADYNKSEVYGVCESSCKVDVNKCYECLYRKVNEGVLP